MPNDTFRSEPAELQFPEDGLPFSPRFQDVYFAQQDAIGESQHVFLAGNKLAERLSTAAGKRSTFVIAELGFGAGLNFMLSWQLWDQVPQRQKHWQKLHYIAFEHYPISTDQLLRLHQLWPALSERSQQLLTAYRSDCRGWQRLLLSDDVTVDLYIGDALTALEQRHPQDLKIDAWFMDGFSPRHNAQLWSSSLCRLMALHSHQQSTAATYSSAGEVRRNLRDAGFKVEKATGFAGKRHMLTATGLEANAISEPRSANQQGKPWFHLPIIENKQKEVVVIGAGLAGSHVAEALARRDWQVRVLERESSLASGVTGIPQLALRCRLFSQVNTESQFFLQAYNYALAFYRWLASAGEIGWHDCGLWQSVDAMNRRSPIQPEIICRLYPASIVRALQSSSLPAAAADKPGFWFEDGGWIDPFKLCKRLLGSANISVTYGCAVSGLERNQGRWQIYDGDSLCDSADHVILANGAGLSQIEKTQTLPLETTLGQCTVIESESLLDEMKVVISGSKTLFPANRGSHTIAASYQHEDGTAKSVTEQDADNLADVKAMFPGTGLKGIVRASPQAMRINTRDRLPVVGPLADFPAMARQYAGLSRNAGQRFSEAGRYLPGLYVSAGHGSSGLSTCPIGGEFLASLINGDCLPLERQSIEMLSSCRFLIQDLKKQREI